MKSLTVELEELTVREQREQAQQIDLSGQLQTEQAKLTELSGQTKRTGQEAATRSADAHSQYETVTKFHSVVQGTMRLRWCLYDHD